MKSAPRAENAKTLSATMPKLPLVTVPPPFFPPAAIFHLDPRIVRWFYKDPVTFKDRVGGTIVYKYASLTKEALEIQIRNHKLLGVNLLMSMAPQNLDKYSRPYQFDDHGKLREGRCFLAQMQHDNVKEQGMIYIGIDGNRIYHANFVPFSSPDPSHSVSTSTGLCRLLDGFDSAENSTEQWEMQGRYTLDLKRENIIWMIEGGIKIEIEPLF